MDVDQAATRGYRSFLDDLAQFAGRRLGLRFAQFKACSKGRRLDLIYPLPELPAVPSSSKSLLTLQEEDRAEQQAEDGRQNEQRNLPVAHSSLSSRSSVCRSFRSRFMALIWGQRDIDARAPRRPVRARTTLSAIGVAAGSFHCTAASAQWISGGKCGPFSATFSNLRSCRPQAPL